MGLIKVWHPKGDYVYYETDETFEKAYPWDPDMPKGWQYREGVNSKGKAWRGYFPSPFEENAEPIWLQAYWPFGDPEELARQRAERVRRREERSRWHNVNNSWGSGDPSTGDCLEGMFFGAPNML